MTCAGFRIPLAHQKVYQISHWFEPHRRRHVVDNIATCISKNIINHSRMTLCVCVYVTEVPVCGNTPGQCVLLGALLRLLNQVKLFHKVDEVLEGVVPQRSGG